VTTAVVFAYSEVGVRCVRELLRQGVTIALLFTHADDPQEQQWFGSVLELAREYGIEAVTPDSPNTSQWLARGAAEAPDFVFSFYYRHMLDLRWLQLPRAGALNMHGSLLPKFRGRAPIHWAIIEGETQTGATLHYMVEKPDAGAWVGQEAVSIEESDDALAVSVKVAGAAERVLRRSLPLLITGTAPAQALDLAQGTYFGRRRPEDGRINWRLSARSVHDLVRAVAPPFPGAFTDVGAVRLGVHKTQIDVEPVQFPANAPCLYTADGQWFADCVDGRRLKILQLTVNGQPVAHNTVPAELSRQPLALT
jgi:methionyl-tRNA formyltransferase